MGDGYYGSLIMKATDQKRHPHLYSDAEVKELRDRLADALDELWQKQ